MAGQKRPLFDFEDKGDNWKRVDPEGVAPIVAVPTTAGTGSEVGRASVIVDEATHIKKIIFHPKMLPATVISDPELTVGLPPRSEEHTSELQSLMRISYAVFGLKKKKQQQQ